MLFGVSLKKRGLEPVDLADVKAAVVRQAPGFGDSWVRSFDWRQNGNIVTAKPRYPMSEMCFQAVKKVFKRFGGKYVRHNNVSYFELVLKEAEQSGLGVSSLPLTLPLVGAEGRFSPCKPEPVFTRLQNKLSSLAAAGAELEREKYCIEKAQRLKQLLTEA